MLRNGTRWCISNFNVIGEKLSKTFEVSEQGGGSEHRVSDSSPTLCSGNVLFWNSISLFRQLLGGHAICNFCSPLANGPSLDPSSLHMVAQCLMFPQPPLPDQSLQTGKEPNKRQRESSARFTNPRRDKRSVSSEPLELLIGHVSRSLHPSHSTFQHGHHCNLTHTFSCPLSSICP